jgi:hypothetical protein
MPAIVSLCSLDSNNITIIGDGGSSEFVGAGLDGSAGLGTFLSSIC